VKEEIVKLLVKVRVDVSRIGELGRALASGGLDRGAVRGETLCLRGDPAVGYSVWEVADRGEFERRFAAWRAFYAEAEAVEVISPQEAMQALMQG
jgi:hypothetical protein